MKGLAQRGHEVTLYTSNSDADFEFMNSLNGVKVHPFKNLSVVAGFCITPDIFAAIKRDITSFDIIHLHCQRSLQHWPIVYKAKQFGVPYIIDSHGSTPIMGKSIAKRAYDVLLGHYIYNGASHYIAQSELGKREYMALGIAPEKISIVAPLPFPVGDFDRTVDAGLFRQQFGIPSNKHIILSMGRLHRIKGVDRCIDGFHKLLETKNDVVLAIAGADSGDLARLKDKVNKLGIGNSVIFVGHLWGDTKLSALSSVDMLVQTSLYEQEAWCPFEAVLCGTPIIVSAHTGAGAEVRSLDAGYLADIDNPYDIANKMLYILENPDKARAKARKAADYLRREATVEKVVEKYEAVYNKLRKR